MGLTTVANKAAKGRAQQYKLTDSDGLHLLVLPNGGRYWRMNYRHLGKYKRCKGQARHGAALAR